MPRPVERRSIEPCIDLRQRDIMNPVIDTLLAHRSIRKFDDRPLDDELVDTLVRCGQAAATSSNVQAVTMVRVTDTETRSAIAALAGNQRHIETAGAFFVCCADMRRPKVACERRGGTYAAGMTEQFVVATVDVALFAQNVVVAAESLDLGTCYIGGLRNDPAQVARRLCLPDFVYPVFGLCIGHPAQDPEVKPRLPLDAVHMRDRYDERGFGDAIDRYDDTMRDYYRTRTGGKKDSNWSDEMKALVGTEKRPHMRGFLEARGFLQK